MDRHWASESEDMDADAESRLTMAAIWAELDREADARAALAAERAVGGSRGKQRRQEPDVGLLRLPLDVLARIADHVQDRPELSVLMSVFHDEANELAAMEATCYRLQTAVRPIRLRYVRISTQDQLTAACYRMSLHAADRNAVRQLTLALDLDSGLPSQVASAQGDIRRLFGLLTHLHALTLENFALVAPTTTLPALRSIHLFRCQPGELSLFAGRNPSLRFAYAERFSAVPSDDSGPSHWPLPNVTHLATEAVFDPRVFTAAGVVHLDVNTLDLDAEEDDKSLYHSFPSLQHLTIRECSSLCAEIFDYVSPSVSVLTLHVGTHEFLDERPSDCTECYCLADLRAAVQHEASSRQLPTIVLPMCDETDDADHDVALQRLRKTCAAAKVDLRILEPYLCVPAPAIADACSAPAVFGRLPAPSLEAEVVVCPARLNPNAICRLTPDILSAIFLDVFPAPQLFRFSWDAERKRKQLIAAIARLCRAFRTAATDLLWQTVRIHGPLQARSVLRRLGPPAQRRHLCSLIRILHVDISLLDHDIERGCADSEQDQGTYEEACDAFGIERGESGEVALDADDFIRAYGSASQDDQLRTSMRLELDDLFASCWAVELLDLRGVPVPTICHFPRLIQLSTFALWTEDSYRLLEANQHVRVVDSGPRADEYPLAIVKSLQSLSQPTCLRGLQLELEPYKLGPFAGVSTHALPHLSEVIIVQRKHCVAEMSWLRSWLPPRVATLILDFGPHPTDFIGASPTPVRDCPVCSLYRCSEQLLVAHGPPIDLECVFAVDGMTDDDRIDSNLHLGARYDLEDVLGNFEISLCAMTNDWTPEGPTLEPARIASLASRSLPAYFA